MFIAQGTIARQAGSGRKIVRTEKIRRIVEEQMHKDDETTASQLHITAHWNGIYSQLKNDSLLKDSTGVDI